MLVVDENLHDQRLMNAMATWYPGQVVSVTALRPHTVVKDDAIPFLLSQVPQPTFVTINVTDFWRKVEANTDYCIVAVSLPKERVREVPALLQRLVNHPEFKTKALRMGKIIRLTPNRIEYYRSGEPIRTLLW